MARARPSRPTKKKGEIEVLFIAGFGPIVKEGAFSRRLYLDTLGIAFEEADGYFHTEKLEGAKAFALWPLSQAAESCFGTQTWPTGTPVPQAWLEFDVGDVARATEILKARGFQVLVADRTEPWGQTVTRLLSPEGLLVGVTHTPWMRQKKRSPVA